MKYVIVAAKDENGNLIEYPVIFPNAINHIEMAACLCVLLAEGDDDADIAPTSAGFVNSMDVKVAPHGKSESLHGMEPLPDDGDFIRAYDYLAGDRSQASIVVAIVGGVKH
ncbi:hypothetical protein [Serratia phage SMP]|uniref:Uncharacterized protein n=1 Tax=Serratia phage SMP TaxID=2982904 RepID=A0A9E8JXF7_9CAUD|nr:hypothetical protein [Serratia phage SMP]